MGTVLDLKDNCVSCSGKMPFVKNAFKLACISYQPGKVLYAQKADTRVNLIKKRENLLFNQ